MGGNRSLTVFPTFSFFSPTSKASSKLSTSAHFFDFVVSVLLRFKLEGVEDPRLQRALKNEEPLLSLTYESQTVGIVR